MDTNYIRVGVSIGKRHRHLYGCISVIDFERIKAGDKGMFTLIQAKFDMYNEAEFVESYIKISKVETISQVNEIISLSFKY